MAARTADGDGGHGGGGHWAQPPYAPAPRAYFAIAMLAAAIAAQLFVSSSYMRPITRGGSGISFSQNWGSGASTTSRCGVVLVLGYLTYRIANSPFGLRLLAIRDDETLAASLGGKTVREKVIAMLLHTAVAGLIGGILAFNLSYIDPTSVFNIQYTEFPIVMVLFGGLGTVLGPVIGGFIFVILYEDPLVDVPTGVPVPLQGSRSSASCFSCRKESSST